jgi:hypothetical protein
VLGSLIFGFLVHGFTVPGQNDTSPITAIEAIPGAIAGMAAVYAIGLRQPDHARDRVGGPAATTALVRRG